MTRGRPVGRRTLITSALGMAGLTACTADDPTEGGEDVTAPARAPGSASDGGGDAAPAADASPAPGAGEPAATASLRYGRAEVTVGVRPIVRHRDHLVLTLDLAAEDPDGDLGGDLVAALSRVWGSASRDWHGLRLLDLERDMIAPPALRTEAGALFRATPPRPGGPLAVSIQIVHGDLGAETAAVYLPKARLVPGIPIIDAEIPSLGPEAEPLDPTASLEAPVFPIVAVTRDLLDPLHEERKQDSVTVDIGADVLFDSSSAELSARAEAVLDDAAARLLEHEPGPVAVIGHTDDVDDEQFNLDLSRRRAESVADALGARIDVAEHPLETEGRGESEPVAENTSAEGRARNRRVELQISAPRREAVAAEVEDSPPYDGEVATGTEGVLAAPSVPRPAHLRVLEARLVSGHLVVTLEAVVEDDVTGEEVGLGGYSYNLLQRSDLAFAFTDGGLAVLTGSTLTFPGLHRRIEDDALVPLTDLSTATRIDGGVPRILELVYPRDIPGVAPGSTVALQLGPQYFRLTDIAVAG